MLHNMLSLVYTNDEGNMKNSILISSEVDEIKLSGSDKLNYFECERFSKECRHLPVYDYTEDKDDEEEKSKQILSICETVVESANISISIGCNVDEHEGEIYESHFEEEDISIDELVAVFTKEQLDEYFNDIETLSNCKELGAWNPEGLRDYFDGLDYEYYHCNPERTINFSLIARDVYQVTENTYRILFTLEHN